MSNSGNIKRHRSHNFSVEETECLVEEVVKRASVIECKKSDAITWKRKETAWADLAEAFNAQTNTNRTVKMLRMKYEGMKKRIKQKYNQGKEETVTLAPWEMKILRLLSSNMEDVKSQNEVVVVVNHAAEMDTKEDFVFYNQEHDSSSAVSEEMHLIPAENVVVETSNERICAWTPEILKSSQNKKIKKSSIISSLPDLIDVQRKVAEQELAKIAKEMEFLRKEDARKEQEHQLRIKLHEAKLELLKLQNDQLLKQKT